MKIKQFRYPPDNFSYLIYGKKYAVAIDGGAVDEILSFINENEIKLKFVVNTHAHSDHTTGSNALLEGSGAEYPDNSFLLKKFMIDIEGKKIKVYHTPGHTVDSVTFHFNNFLITGDTLFNGTVGNCFTGDLKGFYKSIKILMAFPGETIIYAGHDYVKESMAFAKRLEPDNSDIDLFLTKYDPNHVRSTLHEELKINPYLRFNDAKIISILNKMGLPVDTEYERWESIMSIE